MLHQVENNWYEKFILIGLLGVIIMSCNKTEDLEINLSLIHQGNLYGSGAENISKENFVIENEGDWQDLLAQMNVVNNASNHFSETEIDFDEFIVVACFDKIRPSGGYSITISETNVKDIEVECTILRGSLDGLATSVIPQPYYISKLPKTKKKITFKE